MNQTANVRRAHATSRLRALVRATSAIALMASLPALALAATPAEAAGTTMQIAIAAQPLRNALVEWSRQTHVPVVVRDDLVAGKGSAAISGRMTPERALQHMLQGSGLQFQRKGDGTVMIVPVPRRIAVAARPQAAAARLAPAAEAAPDGAADAGVGEILVTTRKREERLRDVEVSVLAISGDDLQERTVVRMTDLTAIVPNFTMSLGALVPATNLRGFGTFGPSFAQSVGKFVDNVSYGRDIHSRIPLFDVAQLEVLRGPQVLLYGNSTTAGALNITTKAPSNRFEGDVSASYEFNHHEAIVQGGVTVPLGDIAALRVAGFYQDLDRGWVINDFNGRHDPTIHNRGIRGTLKLEPTSRLTIKLKAEYTRTRDNGATGQIINQSTSPLRQLVDVTLDNHRLATVSGAPFFSPEFFEVRNQVYQGDISLDTGLGRLQSTTSFLNTREGASLSTNAERFDGSSSYYNRYRQFGQELRLSGTSGNVDYNIGGYYEHYRLRIATIIGINFPVYNLPFPVMGRYLGLRQINDSYSGFADMTLHLSDKLSLSAGARYTVLHQDNDQRSDATPVVTNQTFATTPADLVSRINPSLRSAVAAAFRANMHTFTGIRRKEHHFQPQIVLQYRPGSDAMIYAKYVRGAKQGGVDLAYGGATPGGAIYAPEYARSFEAGIKGVTADRLLEYSLVAFQTTFTDLQASAFVGTTQIVTNVGKARTRGVEAELAIVPARGLRISATASYLDAKYLDFPSGVCTVAQTAATPAGTVCKQDLSNRPTPFQSKYSGTLNMSYQIAAGDIQLTPSVSVTAKSAYNASTNLDPLARQKGLALVDLNLAARHADSGIRASVFVRNLTNRHYLEYGNATPPLVPGGFYVYTARGRSIGVQLGASF